ncbi:MAG: RNA polymerase sigma factor [Planctomycetota bacterium]
MTRNVTGRRAKEPAVNDFAARSDAVLELFEAHYDKVYAFARRSLDPAQAEDIAQEVFFRLMKRENLEHMEIRVGFLFRIADNLIKRRYRRQCRFNRYLDRSKAAFLDEQLDCTGTDSDEMPIATEDSELPHDLAQAMQMLSRHEQEAIRLIVCEGLSYKAAARVLGVPVARVNNWRHRGLTKLRDFLNDRWSYEEGSHAEFGSEPYHYRTTRSLGSTEDFGDTGRPGEIDAAVLTESLRRVG